MFFGVKSSITDSEGCVRGWIQFTKRSSYLKTGCSAARAGCKQIRSELNAFSASMKNSVWTYLFYQAVLVLITLIIFCSADIDTGHTLWPSQRALPEIFKNLH